MYDFGLVRTSRKLHTLNSHKNSTNDLRTRDDDSKTEKRRQEPTEKKKLFIAQMETEV